MDVLEHAYACNRRNGGRAGHRQSHVRGIYLANTSWSVSRVAARVLPDNAPNLLVSLALSTDRIWSRRIRPFLPPCERAIRKGAGRLLVVIGANTTVPR